MGTIADSHEVAGRPWLFLPSFMPIYPLTPSYYMRYTDVSVLVWWLEGVWLCFSCFFSHWLVL